VLVIHAWWGLNGFFKSVCDRLAEAGFVAAAPDLFEGKVATTPAAAKRLRAAPKREPTYKTLIRTIEQLRQHPAVKGELIGVVGFSMGGHWALWLAGRPELPIGAVVTFYGSRAGDFSKSRAAFLGHFAERDEWVSEAALKKLKQTLARANRPAEFFTYPGTSHWFFEADRSEVYDAQAAGLAWDRTLEFLWQNLTSSARQKR
jgi:carboxymethylenebutenolidase